MNTSYTFVLTEEMMKKVYKFREEQNKQLGDVNYGAIGGELTYSFTPTNIGFIIKVKHAMTGEELDLSDYEDW